MSSWPGRGRTVSACVVIALLLVGFLAVRADDPDDVPWVAVPREAADDVAVVDLAMMAGLAPSKGQVRRLIDQGGVELDGERVTDREARTAVTVGMLLRVGKRKFARFKVDDS